MCILCHLQELFAQQLESCISEGLADLGVQLDVLNSVGLRVDVGPLEDAVFVLAALGDRNVVDVLEGAVTKLVRCAVAAGASGSHCNTIGGRAATAKVAGGNDGVDA